MKKVIFWGTRGSLPVALTADNVRQKIVAALNAANGKTFRNSQQLNEFVDTLPFATRGSFGGHSSCVEIVSGGHEQAARERQSKISVCRAHLRFLPFLNAKRFPFAKK